MGTNVLIIGFGTMGQRYSRYLNQLEVNWSYYDPFIPGGLNKLKNMNRFSHIIISTPSENHYDSYGEITDLGFNGYVYIDKPVIICDRQLDIFDNENIFCGMTERYNPVITILKNLLTVEMLTSIKFSRYSTVPENIKTPVLFDLGIHDLDLYLYLLNFSKIPNHCDMFKKTKTCYIMTQQNDVLSIFEWSHESHRRERKVVALQKDIVYEVDLIDQTILSYEDGGVVRNLYVDKAQPLKEIMKSFLRNERCDAKVSHEFMLAAMA